MKPYFQTFSALAAGFAITILGVGAAADDSGVTDLSMASVEVIEADDITQALAVPRGTRIEPTAPPTVRLPIFFEYNSATLRPDAQRLLSKVGAAMASTDLETFGFSIEGHTDSAGSELYNDDLSHLRALAVREYLVAQGVPGTRLDTIGHGESAPVASNATDEGRQRNRRVEVINRGSTE